MNESVVELKARPAEQGSKSAPLTIKDFKGKAEPDWCPGCGDFGVLNSLQKVLAEMKIQPHEAIAISGDRAAATLEGGNLNKATKDATGAEERYRETETKAIAAKARGRTRKGLTTKKPLGWRKRQRSEER